MDVGVRFIPEGDILKGKQVVDTTNQAIRAPDDGVLVEDQDFVTPIKEAMNALLNASVSLPSIPDHEADKGVLASFMPILRDHNLKIKDLLTTGFGSPSISLHSLSEVFEHQMRIDQELLKVLLKVKKEIKQDGTLYDLVIRYSEMRLQISEVYSDFIGILKSVCNGWYLAMLQIEVKLKTGNHNYVESLQQLNELESIHPVLPTKFIMSYGSFSYKMREFSISFWHRVRSGYMKYKSLKAKRMAQQLDGVIRASVLSVLGTSLVWFICIDSAKVNNVPRERSHLVGTWYKSFMHYMRLRVGEVDLRPLETHNCYFMIMEFDDNAILLQKLQDLMAEAGKCDKEEMMIVIIEKDMMNVIKELKEKISGCLTTMEDMSRFAQASTHDLIEAKATLERASNPRSKWPFHFNKKITFFFQQKRDAWDRSLF